MVKLYVWVFPAAQAGKLATITAKLYDLAHPHVQIGATYNGTDPAGDGVIYEVPDHPGAYAIRLDLGSNYGTFTATTGGADSRVASIDVTAPEIVVYDPPTRGEATADKDEILAAIADDFSTGDGDTPVNHNTGGADALAYKTAGGAGIDNAIVRAYVKADYDAGIIDPNPPRTTTNALGRWVADLQLNSGVQYTIRFEAPFRYGPDFDTVTP